MLVLGMRGEHLLAHGAHALDREHGGGGGAVLAQPVVEDALDACADGGERPEGVVEVEGDGADGEAHRGDFTPGRQGPFHRPQEEAPLPAGEGLG